MGRRFDPQLLAAVADDAGDVEARLATMQRLDLVRAEGISQEYAFKHALVRDALYQSLLTEPRTRLHLKIAEEIERRSGNRLTEVVETLAYHYAQTDQNAKAFAFLVMAAEKSLGVYSLDEADKYFADAIALLDAHPDCATDEQVAEFLVGYAAFSHLMMRLIATRKTVERFMPRLNRLADHPNYARPTPLRPGLLASGRYREAEQAQARLSTVAARSQDVPLRAYALVSAIHVSTHTTPYPIDIFEAVSREAITAASSIDDASLRNSALSIVAWAEFHRGRMARAHEIAETLRTLGTRMNDPRSLGLAMHSRSWAALFSDDYSTGLKFAEACLSIARSPYDQQSAETGRAVALALLRRPEAFQMLRDRMALCTANDWQQHLAGLNGIWAWPLLYVGRLAPGYAGWNDPF